MAKGSLLKGSVLVPVFLLSGLFQEWGAEAPGAGTRPDTDALTFKAEVGKTHFSLYEPILLTYSVTNPTREPIESRAILSPMFRSLIVSIVPVTGKPFDVRTWWMDDTIQIEAPTVHPPGRTFTATA